MALRRVHRGSCSEAGLIPDRGSRARHTSTSCLLHQPLFHCPFDGICILTIGGGLTVQCVSGGPKGWTAWVESLIHVGATCLVRGSDRADAVGAVGEGSSPINLRSNKYEEIETKHRAAGGGEFIEGIMILQISTTVRPSFPTLMTVLQLGFYTTTDTNPRSSDAGLERQQLGRSCRIRRPTEPTHPR